MSSSLSSFPQGGSSRPFWRSPSGRITIWLGFLALAALLIWFKSNSVKNAENNSNSSNRGGGSNTRPELLPRGESEENVLAFGGALTKVQDFGEINQNEDFWAVLRDVKNADSAAYATPYIGEYSQLIKNPRHYRLLAKPVRVLGTLVSWWAYPAPENSTGTKDLFRILIHDGEKEGYMIDTWERPPFESSGFKRDFVEVVGIFYQVYRYEGQDTLDDLFRSLYSSLRKGQLSLALTQLQGILDQNPNPLIVASWVKRFEPTLWEAFRAEGPDYSGALRRLDAIAAQGLAAPVEGVELKQHVKLDAPYLIAKSVRLYDGGSASSAFDQFMNSSLGTVSLLGIMALTVGGFFLLFLRMQRAQEEKHKKNREEFWRDVRRNIKGVTPPGDRLGGGG